MSKKKLFVITEIELIDTPYQKMDVALNGQQVSLYFKYNAMTDHWTLDIYKGNKALLTGRKLVLDIDLLGKYNFGLGGIVCLHVTSKEVIQEPNRENLVNGDVRIYASWEEYVEVD